MFERVEREVAGVGRARQDLALRPAAGALGDPFTLLLRDSAVPELVEGGLAEVPGEAAVVLARRDVAVGEQTQVGAERDARGPSGPALAEKTPPEPAQVVRLRDALGPLELDEVLLSLLEQQPTLEMVKRFCGWMYKFRQRACKVGRVGLGDSMAEMAQYTLAQARRQTRSNSRRESAR